MGVEFERFINNRFVKEEGERIVEMRKL